MRSWRRRNNRSALVIAAIAVCAAVARAEDWPQFLGPRRDGSSTERVSTNWPTEGLPRLWQIEAGAGFAGPVVANGKVFLFHRPGNEEKIECFDAATGKSLWANAYRSTYRDDFGFDPGPRSAPTVSSGRVFTYGADGVISAISTEDGKTIWRVEAEKEFGSKKGFFGRSCAPLVIDDLLLIDVGGPNACIVAFDVATGKARWKSGSEEASYSSPTFAVLNGATNALFLTRHQFVSLRPSDGAEQFKYDFGPTEYASVTAATPIVEGDIVFLSGCYGSGATALRIANNKPVKLWANDAMQNHYATCVHRDGLIFGFDGRQEQGAAFACIELKTGKTRWRKERFGSGSVLLANDKLLILVETGELVLADASGEKYRELRRVQVMGSGRAYPALANGALYVRDKSHLIKLDVSR